MLPSSFPPRPTVFAHFRRWRLDGTLRRMHDRLGAQALISQAGLDEFPRLELIWADGAYTGTFARWLQGERGWRVEVPKHRDCHL